MYFGIISKLSYFCYAVHLLSYYIWSFCALAKFTYFVIFCILDKRCKRLKFNQYTFNKTTARPFFFVQSGSATKPALKLRTRTVIVDRFSRFIHAIPLVGISATECVSAFIHQWVALFGCPEKIFCDRGAQFTSSLWTEMSNYLGCEMKHSTAYHPQSQGLVERFLRSLKSSLRAYENSSDWYDNLPWVLLALRNSPKQDLHSLSPSDFVFGQPVRLPGEFFEVNSATQSPTHEYVSKFSKYISRLAYGAPRTANRESHLDAALFSPSCTHVYIRIDSHRSSLAPFYRGPYRVISKHAKYFSVDFRGHSDTVSIDRLKAAQFSFASLNEEVASSSTAHTPPDFDPCDLASHNSSPLTESHSIHIDISEPLTPHVSQQPPSPTDLTSDTSVHFTTRGRMVRPPSRLRDFVL